MKIKLPSVRQSVTEDNKDSSGWLTLHTETTSEFHILHRYRAQGKDKSVASIPQAMHLSSDDDGFLPG